jgi:DNA-binding MarR family transcriptional regulator
MESKQILQLIKVLRESDETQPDLTMSMLEVFHFVAEYGPITQKATGTALGIDPAILSRIVNGLADQVRQNRVLKPGRRLLNVVGDPNDFRGRTLSLAPEGLKLLKQTKAIE